MPSDRFPMQFNHLSFKVPDKQALDDLQQRLEAAGVEVTKVVDHDIVRSVHFSDPNGIALEASWWAVHVIGRPADYGDQRVFADPHPVPAVEELRRGGQLASTPTTRLAGDKVMDLA
jgi:hypothetical protein